MPRTQFFRATTVLGAILSVAVAQPTLFAAGPALSWSEQVDLTGAMPLSSQDRGGRDIAYDGQTLVVGAPFVNDPSDDEGKVFVFAKDDAGTPADPTDDNWTLEATLQASDADVGDQFGADVEVEGGVIVAGAWHDDEAVGNGGAAYVFEYIGGSWIETAKLLPSNPTLQARFGRHIAIDNGTIVVSALREEVGGASNAGAVYVYEFDGLEWAETARLVASDSAADDRFGRDVAIDGNVIAVGAHTALSSAGAVYTFERSGGGWTQTAKLTSPFAQSGAVFGDQVALDGDLLAVGSPHHTDPLTNAGAVAVFWNNGSSWVFQDWLTASDAVTNDAFGRSVDIEGGHVAVGIWGVDRTAGNLKSVYVYTCNDAGTPGDPSDDVWDQTGSFAASAQATGTNLVNDVNLVGDTLVFGQATHSALAYEAGGVFVFTGSEVSELLSVVDDAADEVFHYDDQGLLTTSENLPSGNNAPRGVAGVTGDRRWVIDNDDYVYVTDAAGQSLGSWKALGLSRPEGIAVDGADLWIVDRGTDRAYRFAGATTRTSGSTYATSNFKLSRSNRTPRGITASGGTLWVVNAAGSDRVFVYSTSGQSQGNWSIDSSNYDPGGIAIDPNNPDDLWIVDRGSDAAFLYVGGATRTSGSQGADDVIPLDSNNTSPHGILVH